MSANSLARRFAYTGGVPSGRASRAVLATLLFLLLPVAANAYTLVLRSGRRVTVPDNFKVTPAAVVYEASPGFSVTVWLSNVDVAATERANAEPPGNFARRIRQEPGAGVAGPAPGAVNTVRRAAPRVITNRDLEPSRLRREAQEAEYERTRRERGMPSTQELRRRSEEQDRRLHESALESQAERAEDELESVRSELFDVKRNLDDLSLHLSQQTVTYAPAYASPSYYPYYYAPPFQIITRFPFGRRGGFGRGSFGPRARGLVWPSNPWQGHSFPSFGGPRFNRGAPPPVMAPAAPMHRR
jgi:hypothetical protein